MLRALFKVTYIISLVFVLAFQAEANEDLGILVGEELILEVHVGKYYIGDIIALKQEQGAFIGLQSFADAVRFPIGVDITTGSAEGWFLRESNRFSLAIADGKLDVVIKEELLTHGAAGYQLTDDIYLDVTLLEQWFGIRTEFDFGQSKVELFTDKTLPFLEEIERERRLVNNFNLASKPLKNNDYQAWSQPNATIRTNYFNRDGESNFSSSIDGSNDILYHRSQYSLNINDDADINGFLQFDKNLALIKESDEVLGISSYKFGDIIVATNGAKSGVGFEITNKTNQFYSDSDTIIVEGAIPEGWDVELYQNGTLINRIVDVTGGRYLFENVNLFYGENRIKTVLYGPEGQIREDEKLYRIDENKSDNAYSLSLQKVGDQLFNDSASGEQYNLGANLSTKAIFNHPVNFSAEIIDDKEADDLTQIYRASTSFRLFDDNLLGLSYSETVDKERSLSTSFNTSLLGQGINFNVGFTDNFAVEQERIDSRLSIAGSIYQGTGWGINHQTSVVYNENPTGDDDARVNNSLTFYQGRFVFNNRIFWTGLLSEDNKRAGGSAAFATSWLGGSLRGGLNYTIRPESELDSIDISFNKHFYDKYNVNTSLAYQLDDDSTTARTTLSWFENYFRLNSSISYNTNSGYFFGLTAQVAFGVNPLNNDLFLSKYSLSSTGNQIVRVFEDRNFNGIYDGKDVLVEGATVKLVQFNKKKDTNTKGIAMFNGLPEGHSDLVVDPTSIVDPLLKPAIDGLSVKPRKGSLAAIDYPLVRVAELEGYVRARNASGLESPATGLNVNVVNEQGLVVASGATSFDGYYFITNLLPGNYTVKFDGEALNRKKLKQIETVKLKLKPEEIKELDIMLLQKERHELPGLLVGEFNSAYLMTVFANTLTTQFTRVFNEQLELFQLTENGKLSLYIKTSDDSKTLEDIQQQLLSLNIESEIKALLLEI